MCVSGTCAGDIVGLAGDASELLSPLPGMDCSFGIASIICTRLPLLTHSTVLGVVLSCQHRYLCDTCTTLTDLRLAGKTRLEGPQPAAAGDKTLDVAAAFAISKSLFSQF